MLREVLREIKSLEPLPSVALQVLQMAGDDEVVPGELVEVIQTDAALTAKVLRLTNSAYYGFQREIASLAEAGNLLGVATLVNLVLTSCTGRYFRNLGRATSESTEKLWEASVSNALAAQMLARVIGDVDKNRAYTVGLLQNIGHFVVDRFVGNGRERLFAEMRRGTPSLEAERAVFGMHHAEIGGELAARWDFPDVLVDTIRQHHSPEYAAADPMLAYIANMGENLAQSLGRDGSHPYAYELTPNVVEETGLLPHQLDELRHGLGIQVSKARMLVELA